MRLKVALLGSSGIVSQRFQQRLANHPWFELAAVFGSSKNSGISLQELPWNLPETPPELPDIKVINCPNNELNFQLRKLNIQLVFSALPTAEAELIESILRAGGNFVFSNSAAHRMDSDVPLVIPELNPEHLQLFTLQRNNGSGAIACSTNCTVMPVAIPLATIATKFGIISLNVRSEQSLSGGGLELMAAATNSTAINPEIPGEAEKIAEEALRLLGKIESSTISPATFSTNIACQRIMRQFGHTVHVKTELDGEPELNDVVDLLANYTSLPQTLDLPSAPINPIIIRDDEISPKEDCWAGATNPQNRDPAIDLKAGMAIVISNLSVERNVLSFSAFSENTIRGAAGGCLLLAELAFKQELLL